MAFFFKILDMHSSDLLFFVVFGGTDPLTSMIREVIPSSGISFDSTLVGLPRVFGSRKHSIIDH